MNWIKLLPISILKGYSYFVEINQLHYESTAGEKTILQNRIRHRQVVEHYRHHHHIVAERRHHVIVDDAGILRGA